MAQHPRRTVTVKGTVVESWYDRCTRSWVTQTKDSDGFQQGDADFDGDQEGMLASHKVRVAMAGGPKSTRPARRYIGLGRNSEVTTVEADDQPDAAWMLRKLGFPAITCFEEV